jgi:hypothetical protein
VRKNEFFLGFVSFSLLFLGFLNVLALFAFSRPKASDWRTGVEKTHFQEQKRC